MREHIDITERPMGVVTEAALSACLRRIGASEFSVVAGADQLDGAVTNVRIVTGEEPIARGELLLVDAPRDVCWTLAPKASIAGAAGLVIARDWSGGSPALLTAFVERLGLPVLAWNAETTWSALRLRFLEAMETAGSLPAEPAYRNWGPSTLLSVLEGDTADAFGAVDVEAGARVLAFTPVQSSQIAGATEEALDRAIWLSLLDPEVPSDAEGVRIGQTAYVLVRYRRDEAELREIAEHIRRLLSVTLDRAVLGAIGAAADDVHQLASSRAEAERVLTLAHRRTTPGTATLSDVQHLALLEQAAAVLTAQPHLLSQKLATLRRSDATRNTSYVAVLRAHLDNFGDVNSAAAKLGMHHNTFRYRLKRGVEIAGIDLDDPAERLALQVELALDH